MRRIALLAGATGLVGHVLLSLLLDDDDVAEVVVLTRRPLATPHPKLQQGLVDFDQLEDFALPAVDDYYCCLGTTIKRAGSQPAFRQVDLAYPVSIARMALAAGATRCLFVSAMGADARSRVFYNRVKGEAEQAVLEVGVPQTWFFRPSFLTGDRQESRPGERVGILVSRLLSPLLLGPVRKYRPIAADAVAAAMVYAATRDLPAGVIESDRIAELAARSE